ncbi:MAG: nucleotidyltransferase domain-containing protein [Desulfobacterales bacterium]
MNVCDLKPRDRETLLEQIGATLHRHQEILFAFCHGSFAEDRPFRDIDLAVFLDPGLAPEVDFRYEMQLESEIEKAINRPAPIDVRLLNTAKLSFQYHALKGRLLLDRQPDIRIDFTTKTLARYLDIAPILKFHTKEAFAGETGP